MSSSRSIFALALAAALAVLSSPRILRAAGIAEGIPEHGASSTTCARSWEYAFVTGNGKMGAMMMGGGGGSGGGTSSAGGLTVNGPGGTPGTGVEGGPTPEEETIYMSHCRLFLPVGAKEVVPDLAKNLPQLRETLRTRGYPRAIMDLMEAATPQGFPGLTYTDPFHPAFELHIKTATTGPARGYLRTEDFSTGEVAVRWSDDLGMLGRKLFISRPDNVAVLWLGPLGGSNVAGAATNGEMSGARTISCEISIPPIPALGVRTYMQNNPKAQPQAALANSLIQCTTRIQAGDITLHNLYREGAGSGYDCAIRITADGGTLHDDGAKVTITNARSVIILMRIEPFKTEDTGAAGGGGVTGGGGRGEGGGDGGGSAERLRAALDQIPADYGALLAAHLKSHSQIFDRITIDLGGQRTLTTEELLNRAAKDGKLSTALLERMYEGSRYAFLSSAGERPPNLQGIWTGAWAPAWSSDYLLNADLELEVSSALSANMPEGLLGLFNLIDENLPDWRLNAKNLYGARGIFAPSRESTNGKSLHWSDGGFPGGLFWTCGAGWLAHWYYDYYLYTGDRDFLARRAVPYMKQAALFDEDFLFLDSSGKYRFSPSYSAENGAGDNSAQDIMVARELLTNLIAACTELGTDKESIPRWKSMLDKLPPYVITENGELQEWATPGAANKNNHRHMSNLYAIFQSNEFDPEKTPDLWLAAHNAYLARLNQWFRASNTRDPNSQATLGRMQLALCAARFGEGDVVWEILTKMVTGKSIYPSMLSSNVENGRLLCVDANGAIPEILNNCLLYSQPGRLDLLPALPTALPRGQITGLLARGQITIDRLHWEPGLIELTLTSAKDQTLELRIPEVVGTISRADALNATLNPTPRDNTRTLTLKANRQASIKLTLK